MPTLGAESTRDVGAAVRPFRQAHDMHAHGVWIYVDDRGRLRCQCSQGGQRGEVEPSP